jgi:hypothetical protein
VLICGQLAQMRGTIGEHRIPPVLKILRATRSWQPTHKSQVAQKHRFALIQMNYALRDEANVFPSVCLAYGSQKEIYISKQVIASL